VTLGGAVTAVDVPSGMRWRSAPEVGVDVAAPITLPVKFKSYTWRDVFSAMVDVNDFVASVTVDRLP
jgi:NAD(P)H-hydrate repair Nnr-like enzyme with NAD(P)H-hydrate epimerase domain